VTTAFGDIVVIHERPQVYINLICVGTYPCVVSSLVSDQAGHVTQRRFYRSTDKSISSTQYIAYDMGGVLE
jgi:hypothetical protein